MKTRTRDRKRERVGEGEIIISLITIYAFRLKMIKRNLKT